MSARRPRASLVGRTALPALAAALALLAALHGCSKQAGTPSPKADCASRADCNGGLAGGLLCSAGQCVGCTRSRDCRLTEACDPVQRRCILRPCFGDQCTAHADCALGLFCVQGLCLDPQAPSNGCAVVLCGSARDCNPGQRCSPARFVCETDLGCAQETAAGDAGVSVGADAGAADGGAAAGNCPAGQVCNAASGACEPGCTEATAPEVCGPIVPCKQGRCVQCAQDSDCGPGLACDVGAGGCRGANACSQSRDCTVPLVCDRASGTCAASRPPCTSNESCAADERCESRTGACIPGACQPDRFAPDGTQAQAAPIAPGSIPQLTLCSREEDWYVLQLRSGDLLQVVADTDPLGSFDLQLFSPVSALLDEGPLAVLATAGATGPYWLRARSNDASAVYGLRVTVRAGTPCAHNPPDPHPGPGAALALDPGPHYDLSVCPGEATWFLLRPPAGAGVEADAALDPTAGGALLLALYDSDGRTLLANDASGGAALRVSAVASAGGTFFLEVQGATSAATAHYDLTVRSLAP